MYRIVTYIKAKACIVYDGVLDRVQPPVLLNVQGCYSVIPLFGPELNDDCDMAALFYLKPTSQC